MEGMALKKGAEALGEELGVFGQRVTSGKAPVVATAVAYSPVGSSSSSMVVSGQRAVEATAVVAVDETGEGNTTAQFLEKEICDNIYLS
ncbi:MAG: hypothetical protein A3F67_05345 [Verrucomicrobia bacterium RIFCSPHIGHO2_12_FULL_41_10]|nr:MAG: hypothetical protein A3F67_05345 [Verrucomicrobia bacterium RIFCSPHIGHO2_12_FULL_41_10]